jgi:hypothetical protein
VVAFATGRGASANSRKHVHRLLYEVGSQSWQPAIIAPRTGVLNRDVLPFDKTIFRETPVVRILMIGMDDGNGRIRALTVWRRSCRKSRKPNNPDNPAKIAF